jgi:predicted phage baseplate assembly protein
MAAEKICPCDGLPGERLIFNPPARDHFAYRVGDFVSFRHALLEALTEPPGPEHQLDAWRPTARADLGVQMLEWWAYLADILTFYNERIANESFLRTAVLPESLRNLIRTLGYRPRPGIAAHGVVVALIGGHQTLLMPRGFAVDSKPGPDESPQTFELDADTVVRPDGAVPAQAPGYLLAPASTKFYLLGTSVPFALGDVLILASRAESSTPALLRVTALTTEPDDDGRPRTSVGVTPVGSVPTGLRACDVDMLYAAQATPVWGSEASAIGSKTVHLACVARDLHPGDLALFTAPQKAELLRVDSTIDAIWYANHDTAPGKGPTDPPPAPQIPIPMLHSVLTLATALDSTWKPDATTMRYGWRSVGQLLDQPVTAYTGTTPLAPRPPARFPTSNAQPVLIGDSAGAGMAGVGSSSASGSVLTLSGLPQPPVSLKPPLTVHYNLLAVSRGKSVRREVLGSGDATVANQSFVLKKSPLTYLAKGDGFVSTLAVRVNGGLWREAPSFYDQLPDAEIFVTAEDEENKTRVMFGDGVNGARLPTGIDNVVASYRLGSGAKSAAAGALTVIAKPYPDLKSLKNPVAMGGGADPDPPDRIRRFAPRSVLTFGRAISGDDYEVIAAQAPGVTRVQAVWSFDSGEQRAAMKIYVGDDQNAVDSARAAIAATADPHRHVVLTAATPIVILLGLAVIIDGRFEFDAVRGALRAAMLDEEHGLFGARRLGIGEAVFDSQIAAACLGCEGVIALRKITFVVNGASGFAYDTRPRHAPGEGAFYAVDPQWLIICPEASTDAG